MKSKKIPADKDIKSINEAKKEIESIINELEDTKTNLKESTDKYNKMVELNNYIQKRFKKTASDINSITLDKNGKIVYENKK
ncbi:MAG: hypothetical protein CBC24_04640 [Candidatus Pelagibacter sp. TMED64]|nr:hypothetical protein [Candidatus Pelagibacter sp.]OUU65827.1 MAG: hypothetical protein CBC24_04640 [Candidatus Pelagibacter sp. TMED64]|tara:strand:- start:183 stop:428 length:246 start_codon:yes stop_codon:yes gene_type:complete